MLLSGKLKPATVSLPLFGVEPPVVGVLPQAAAIVATTASAAMSHTDIGLRFIELLPLARGRLAGCTSPPRSERRLNTNCFLYALVVTRPLKPWPAARQGPLGAAGRAAPAPPARATGPAPW